VGAVSCGSSTGGGFGVGGRRIDDSEWTGVGVKYVKIIGNKFNE